LKAVRIVTESNPSRAALGEQGTTCSVQANAITANDRLSWLIDGTWLAEDIGGAGVIYDAQSTIAFAASGGVNGSGGRNRYRAPAEITGEMMKLEPVAAARMACAPTQMDLEQKFFAELELTKSFRFEEMGLFLLGAEGSRLVRLMQLR
jgi:heat shock protein HslJ